MQLEQVYPAVLSVSTTSRRKRQNPTVLVEFSPRLGYHGGCVRPGRVSLPMNRRVIIGLLLLLLVAAAAWQFRRPAATPQNQVRRLLAKAEKGAEERNVGACLSCVSTDYSDSLGNTKRSLRQLALSGFRSVDALDVTVHVRSLQVNGSHARVKAHVTLTAIQRGQTPEQADSDLEIYLRRERHGWRRQWKVVRVEGWNFPSLSGF